MPDQSAAPLASYDLYRVRYYGADEDMVCVQHEIEWASFTTISHILVVLVRGKLYQVTYEEHSETAPPLFDSTPVFVEVEPFEKVVTAYRALT